MPAHRARPVRRRVTSTACSEGRPGFNGRGGSAPAPGEPAARWGPCRRSFGHEHAVARVGGHEKAAHETWRPLRSLGRAVEHSGHRGIVQEWPGQPRAFRLDRRDSRDKHRRRAVGYGRAADARRPGGRLLGADGDPRDRRARDGRGRHESTLGAGRHRGRRGDRRPGPPCSAPSCRRAATRRRGPRPSATTWTMSRPSGCRALAARVGRRAAARRAVGGCVARPLPARAGGAGTPRLPAVGRAGAGDRRWSRRGAHRARACVRHRRSRIDQELPRAPRAGARGRLRALTRSTSAAGRASWRSPRPSSGSPGSTRSTWIRTRWPRRRTMPGAMPWTTACTRR